MLSGKVRNELSHLSIFCDIIFSINRNSHTLQAKSSAPESAKMTLTVTKKTQMVYAPTPGESGIEMPRKHYCFDVIISSLTLVFYITAIMSSKYVERNEITEGNVVVMRDAKVSDMFIIFLLASLKNISLNLCLLLISRQCLRVWFLSRMSDSRLFSWL